MKSSKEFNDLFGNLQDKKNMNPLAKLARDVKKLQEQIKSINKKK